MTTLRLKWTRSQRSLHNTRNYTLTGHGVPHDTPILVSKTQDIECHTRPLSVEKGGTARGRDEYVPPLGPTLSSRQY